MTSGSGISSSRAELAVGLRLAAPQRAPPYRHLDVQLGDVLWRQQTACSAPAMCSTQCPHRARFVKRRRPRLRAHSVRSSQIVSVVGVDHP